MQVSTVPIKNMFPQTWPSGPPILEWRWKNLNFHGRTKHNHIPHNLSQILENSIVPSTQIPIILAFESIVHPIKGRFRLETATPFTWKFFDALPLSRNILRWTYLLRIPKVPISLNMRGFPGDWLGMLSGLLHRQHKLVVVPHQDLLRQTRRLASRRETPSLRQQRDCR